MKNETIRFILKLILLLVFGLGMASVLESQNRVIVNGQFNEVYDMESVSDVSIGNTCEIPNFINLYYNGDVRLKGDMYVNDCILTIYGELDKNGFDVVLNCPDSDVIIENTLTIEEPLEDSYVLYPNPTKGMFYVKTRKKYNVDVYDAQGKHLTDLPDLREFPTGVYLAVITIDNRTIAKRIIKA